MKQIALCVDDFGIRPEVDDAVVALTEAGIVTVTGCLSLAPGWPQAAQRLRGALRPKLDVGLHLNLTEALGPNDAELRLPLPGLIARSLLRTLPAQRLRHSIERQLQAFDEAFGEPPDFVDGHQHVHQLPQVRDTLLAALHQRYGTHRPWLRLTSRADRGLKPWVIESLGSRGLRRLAALGGHRTNGRLLGVYGFDEDVAGYAGRLQQWLQQGRDGDLLMLHPAVPAAADPILPSGDPIARARVVEFTVLTQQGPELLTRCGVRPVRPSTAWRMLPP